MGLWLSALSDSVMMAGWYPQPYLQYAVRLEVADVIDLEVVNHLESKWVGEDVIPSCWFLRILRFACVCISWLTPLVCLFAHI